MKVFRKTGVSTLINILGMSVAFAAAMILMVQVRWDMTYDANFVGHEQVFRVENNWMDQGLFSTHIGRPFIERARDASPNIEAICTWQPLGEDVLYKEGDRESGKAPSPSQWPAWIPLSSPSSRWNGWKDLPGSLTQPGRAR